MVKERLEEAGVGFLQNRRRRFVNPYRPLYMQPGGSDDDCYLMSGNSHLIRTSKTNNLKSQLPFRKLDTSNPLPTQERKSIGRVHSSALTQLPYVSLILEGINYDTVTSFLVVTVVVVSAQASMLLVVTVMELVDRRVILSIRSNSNILLASVYSTGKNPQLRTAKWAQLRTLITCYPHASHRR